jgi:hypothetical protein
METTSRNKARNKISPRDLFFYRQRQKNRLFQAVVSYFAEQAQTSGLTKKDIADTLDKHASQVTRWFAGPGNWEMDTVSDLLLAMDAELEHRIVPLKEHTGVAVRLRTVDPSSALPRSSGTEDFIRVSNG